MNRPDRIVVIDQHALYQEAHAGLMDDAWPEAEVRACAEADVGALAGALAGAALVLVDLDTLREPFKSDLAAFVGLCGGACVVTLAQLPAQQRIVCAMHAGARGFIAKTMQREAIRHAVAAAFEGFACFPASAFAEVAQTGAASAAIRCRRELDVLRQLDRGSSNKAIARELGVSLATVKAHVQSILRSTQAKNRTEAVANARRMGLLPTH